jgi:tetratricopeptide (TPR) repeat protein
MKKALEYPHNLGEGKLHGAQENNINYYIGCAYEFQGDRERAADYFGRTSVGLAEPASAMFYNDQPPEMIFYQGAALQKLGRSDEATGRFNRLIDYGELHLRDHVTIDYFAVSLPDFLVFEEDLDRKNAVHCRYLLGLGYLGKGMAREAKFEFEQALALDCNHQGVLAHIKLLAGN